jgi:hypothetical protein
LLEATYLLTETFPVVPVVQLPLLLVVTESLVSVPSETFFMVLVVQAVDLAVLRLFPLVPLAVTVARALPVAVVVEAVEPLQPKLSVLVVMVETAS